MTTKQTKQNKRGSYIKHNWTPEDDALFHTKTNVQVSNILGIPYGTVQGRRVALGIPLVRGPKRKYRKSKVVYVEKPVQKSGLGLMSMLRRLFTITPKTDDRKPVTKRKVVNKRGRPAISCSDYPRFTNWDASPSVIKRKLKVSFYVAKRLKQEALALHKQSATVAAHEKNKNRNTQR